MRLKELRKQNQKTQEDIAQYLHIARSTYNGYEQNISEPTIETLSNLANYYNVSLDYLIGRDFKEEIGYLDELELNILKMTKKLNQQNKLQALAYISGLFTAQE